MMGPRQIGQAALFYEFSLEDHVPAGHLLRSIDRFVDLSGLRRELAPCYSSTGRPSVDPELMIRILIVGYCFGVRSERRLCDEVHLNLACRWFCRLGLDGRVPDHSTFSKSRHGRFRDSDLLRQLFETVLSRCIGEGLAGGEGFAVDGSLIEAYFAYETNLLIDLDHAIIVDVEPTTAIRQAEVAVAKRMIERLRERFGFYPARLAADSGYGSADMLGWLVYEQGIEPHVSVFDKSRRRDGTFQRSDFTFDHAGDAYFCTAGKMLATNGRLVNDETTLLYRASTYDCQGCELKAKCCPNTPARKIPRSKFEGARDMAREIMDSRDGRTSKRQRKKVEMLFAHLKRILKLDRLRLRGPNGARDEFLLAATAQKLRKMAKLIPLPAPAPA